MNSKKFAKLGYGLLLLGLIAAPLVGAYPVFVMKLMCFALFACAFNLLLGYTGLLSFGHAAFFGGAAYVTGHAIKVWHLTPELGILFGVVFGAVLGVFHPRLNGGRGVPSGCAQNAPPIQICVGRPVRARPAALASAGNRRDSRRTPMPWRDSHMRSYP